MLLDFEEQVEKLQLNVTGVVHVGTHLAEEAPVYDRLGVPVLWVEANPDLLEKITAVIVRYPKQFLAIGFAVTDKDDEEIEFKITNYDSMSSSVFEFGTHPTFSPDTIVVERRMLPTITIDRLMGMNAQAMGDSYWKPNTLVMDIQGAELLALKGATNFLKQVDQIYCEVNTAEVYKGCAQLWELEEFLEPDFELMAVHMVGNQGWGDGLFCRVKAPVQ